jgi:nicotinamide N-methyltransferase
MEGSFLEQDLASQIPPYEPQYRYESYTVQDGPTFSLRLVERHRLWGHFLWNAGKVAAELIFSHKQEWIAGKSVLEFGAASSLPSIVAAASGASFVCSTDYDDDELIHNIQHNFHANQPLIKAPFLALGYVWGSGMSNTNQPGYTPLLEANGGKPYEFVIMADLVFNHCVRDKLLNSCKALIGPSSLVLVTFTAHRPHLLEEDLKFFSLAQELGFEVEQLPSVETGVMFEEDPGDAAIRAKVWVFIMRLSTK